MSKKHKHRNYYKNSEAQASADLVKIEESTTVKEDFEVQVSKAVIIQECPNKSSEPTGTKASIVSLVPVLVADCDVNINLEVIIQFSQPVLEVTKLNNEIVLTRKDYLPQSSTLFLDGFVRQYIQYAIVKSNKKNSIGGEIMFSVFYIPFKATTYVKIIPQKLKKENNIIIVNSNRKDVFCELAHAKVSEINIEEEKNNIDSFIYNEYTFKRIKQKIAISLGIKLFQDREVSI
ncbi:DUF7852 domain-containing protein [Clostridium sp. DL1XJH146]